MHGVTMKFFKKSSYLTSSELNNVYSILIKETKYKDNQINTVTVSFWNLEQLSKFANS